MKLLVDIGNSRIKWELRQQRDIVAAGDDAHGIQDFFHLLDRIWGTIQKPSAVWIASVGVEEFGAQLTAWCQAHWSLRPAFAHPEASAAGVRTAYLEPQRLGVDRWLALLAARHLYTKTCCIADCGTALTLDAIDASGHHVGGIIVPGMALMQSALTANTARIRSTASGTINPFACSTADALAAGASLATVAVIDRFVTHVHGTYTDVVNIITGGDAPRVLPELQHRFAHIPNLVLTGLSVLAAADT